MKKNTDQINVERINLLGINVLKSSVNASEEYIQNPKDWKTNNIDFSIEGSINLDKEYIRQRLSFYFKASDQNSNPIGLMSEFLLDCHYNVEGLEEYVKVINGKKEVNFNLSVILFSISYSTSRGIIHERLNGTFYNNLILPIIKPAEMLKQQIEFNEQEE